MPADGISCQGGVLELAMVLLAEVVVLATVIAHASSGHLAGLVLVDESGTVGLSAAHAWFRRGIDSLDVMTGEVVPGRMV